jgi:anti-sigma-K factor RskA
MTTDANHDVLREQVALYAIGALAAPERVAVETHLRQCDSCSAELKTLLPIAGALAQVVPQHDPPAALRATILAAARRESSSVRTPAALAPWLAAAAMFVLTAGLGLYVGQLRAQVRSLELRLRDAMARVDEGERRITVALREAANAREPLAVLTAPDLRRINLAGQQAAPAASARAYWSRSRGVVLTGENLPSLPPGRIYQLWFVPPGARAPVSAGLIRPDDTGRLTAVLNTPADVPEPAALAVTIEPEGGVPAPTGAMYLVGAAH